VNEPTYDAITAWAYSSNVHDPMAYFASPRRSSRKAAYLFFW